MTPSVNTDFQDALEKLQESSIEEGFNACIESMPMALQCFMDEYDLM
jgi:hypothetical protein